MKTQRHPINGTKIPGVIARRAVFAFTLIELLVVIVIIGLMAKVALPAIKGMTKSNAIITANRQLLDDLALARRSAIANRTTVYVAFIPPTIATDPRFDPTFFQNDTKARTIMSNLYRGQFTTYALISLRSVGDQPGRPRARYLTEWRSLPNGVFIATNKFDLTKQFSTVDPNRAFPTTSNEGQIVFPFPTVANGVVRTNVVLPFIGFDFLGRLVSPNFQNEVIPLARGSIFYNVSADGTYARQPADVLETPAGNSVDTNTFNFVRIDYLTGKARVENAEIK